MKIERDKVYLTRCGDKVRAVCVDAPEPHTVVLLDSDGLCYRITPDGKFLSNDESANDLVSEYVEPPKPREVWVRVVDGHFTGGIYYTADPFSGETNEQLVKFREVIE